MDKYIQIIEIKKIMGYLKILKMMNIEFLDVHLWLGLKLKKMKKSII